MICNDSNPDFSFFIDRYISSIPESDENYYCSRCGRMIKSDESYFYVNDNVFCSGCGEYADRCILDAVRDDYIYIF